MADNLTTAPNALSQSEIAIVGLGLMGASLAYDLRGYCRRVVGVVRRSEAVEEALAAGCVDAATLNATTALACADVVVLATPVRTILRQIAEWGPLLKPGAILVDLGSTKTAICQAMNALPAHVQAVGGHPMCGKERAGLAAAQPGLYQDSPFVLCPLPRTTEATMQLMHQLILHIGAREIILDPERHDRLVAAISHLPYLTACALVGHAMAVGQTDPTVWQVASSGFRDSSRVAASDVRMFADILLTNRAAILEAIDDFQQGLARLRSLLEQEQETELRAVLEDIAQARRAWTPASGSGPPQP